MYPRIAWCRSPDKLSLVVVAALARMFSAVRAVFLVRAHIRGERKAAPAHIAPSANIRVVRRASERGLEGPDVGSNAVVEPEDWHG